jgi:tRNA G10  N-methylase Trm11
MQSLCILGRQPALGLTELESLYGGDKLRAVGNQAVIIDVDPCLLAFDRLGGSVKFAKVLTTLETTEWSQIEKFLHQVSPGHAQSMPEGKMQLGLSVYGLQISRRQLEASGLSLKKAIRKTGRSVRLIPNKELELNSAQVLHNHLTGPTGWELLFIRDGKYTIIAQTVKIQNITAYSKRDQERPRRDAKVGMLPPKLAQIIINLASGNLAESELKSICDIPADAPISLPELNKTLLDPFCGSGVILQEAALMGYKTYGSDNEERMVKYSEENLKWLETLYPFQFDTKFELGDATRYKWTPEINLIASEAYLGRPFTLKPPPDVLAQTVMDCNLIIKKFLNNINQQVASGTRLCLAVPAWQIRLGEFKHLPLIDQIGDLGYNRVSFEHASLDQMIYYRPDQFVARELLVLTRI